MGDPPFRRTSSTPRIRTRFPSRVTLRSNAFSRSAVFHEPRLAAVDVADHEALRCHPDHRRARRAIAIEERTFVKSVFKAGTAGVAHVQSRERAPRHARKEAARTFGETVPTGASYRCG